MIETFMNLDATILLWIQEHMRAEWLTPIFTFITTLGNAGIAWIIASVAMLCSKKTRKIGILCLYAMGISFVFNNLLLKQMVARLRPYDAISSIIPLISKPADFAFPSGHTATSFACAWLMLRKLPKKYGVPAMILAGLIGFSRMYLGVHYPSDVIAGAVSGILCSYLADFILGTLFFQWSEKKSE